MNDGSIEGWPKWVSNECRKISTSVSNCSLLKYESFFVGFFDESIASS